MTTDPNGTRWSAGQVAALAPDPAALSAGRGQANPTRWTSLGASRSPSAIWGLCRGSGSTPYQTIVDLDGPAFRCSCPSRKFPCKHAIGLMLLWAGEQVPERPEPSDFAAVWLATRAGRKTPPETERSGGLADPAAAAKRAEVRAARVARGIAELEQWLRDQARTGLAGSGRSGYGPADQVAARLVDAQAPGLANWVRNLPGVAASGAGWPERLLTEFGLLHLLARAHQELNDLPDQLAGTVRSRVGYTVRTADVLATPPVRDFWNVLSLDDELQDILVMRRIQLHGSRTGRAAVVLSYSAGGQPLDSSLAPGTSIDADLHFYPGAGFRALVGERHGDPGPLMHTGGLSLEQALQAWSAGLAADPWVSDLPAVLGGVVPVPPVDPEPGSNRGWSLVQGAAALPLLPSAGLWSLLAVSGGEPVDVAGSITARGVRATAVRAGDRMVAL